jgi:hypothetical protein
MPRITLKLPVSVELTDEQLADAETVNEAVGLVARVAKSPEMRDVAGRLVDLAKRKFGKRRPRRI